MTLKLDDFQPQILPIPDLIKEPENVADLMPWLKQFHTELTRGSSRLLEATRTQLTQLQDDYIAADSFLEASITVELGVLTTAVSALATRTTQLESEVQTPTTGLLARVTVTESSIVTLGTDLGIAETAIASISTELVAARDGESSLLAKINVVEAAIVSGDAAVASTVTTLDAQVNHVTTGLPAAHANITSEASTRATADSALSSSITTLSATVDTKNRTFRQTTAPTATQPGDLWIDSDDNNKLYRATAAGSGSWVATDDSRIASTLATVTNIAEAYATNNGSTARLVWEVAVGTNVATLVQTAANGYSDGTWNGSAISLSANYITLAADAINFGANTTFETTKNTFRTVSSGGTVRRYRYGGPFGASDDILMWFGPDSVALNSETKTNGYFAFGTDGVVYFGADPLTPAPPAQLSIDINVIDGGAPLGDVDTFPTAPRIEWEIVGIGGVAPYTLSWIRGPATGTAFTTSIETGDTLTLELAGGGGLVSGTETWIAQVIDDAGTIVQQTYPISLTQLP